MTRGIYVTEKKNIDIWTNQKLKKKNDKKNTQIKKSYKRRIKNKT